MSPKNQLGLLLFLVSRAHHHLASQVFERLGLPRGQPPVLFELGHQDGVTQSELAKTMEVTAASMTNMLVRLEQAGLVRRVRDRIDTRMSRVYLTETGRKALVQAQRAADELDRRAFAGFSPAEQSQMHGYLERIHANLVRELAAAASAPEKGRPANRL